MKEIELKVPNLGEAEDTEIIEISVKEGDSLKMNDPIIVLESEKAAMEVPSDYEGVIKEIKVKEGDKVSEGAIFAVIEVDETKLDEGNVSKSESYEKESNSQSTETERKKNEINQIDLSGINAGPAVRKIARELEIDLKNIIGSGKNQMITKDDLKNFIHSLGNGSKNEYASLESLKIFGEYEVENQSKIRKAAAKNLTISWQSIPHVSHFDEADITKIEKQRKDLNKLSEVKITPLAYLVMAISLALKKYPLINSSLIAEGKLMLKKYVNIGIAVNTDQGLVVPVIKDVEALNINQIAEQIIILSEKARNKKLMKEDISGATFTVSSLGSIGGTGFIPIINPPEVGIIGVSRAKKSLHIDNESYVEKIFLPYSFSYDHRVINGVDAGNFTSFINTTIEKGL